MNVDPDDFQWSHPDAMVRGALDGCLHIIATHDGQPKWAAEQSKGPLKETSMFQFKQYFREVVERYDGDGYKDAPGSPVVTYWEMYNEPDVWAFGDIGGWGKRGPTMLRC